MDDLFAVPTWLAAADLIESTTALLWRQEDVAATGIRPADHHGIATRAGFVDAVQASTDRSATSKDAWNAMEGRLPACG